MGAGRWWPCSPFFTRLPSQQMGRRDHGKVHQDTGLLAGGRWAPRSKERAGAWQALCPCGTASPGEATAALSATLLAWHQPPGSAPSRAQSSPPGWRGSRSSNWKDGRPQPPRGGRERPLSHSGPGSPRLRRAPGPGAGVLVRVEPPQASWSERQHDGDAAKDRSLLLGERPGVGKQHWTLVVLRPLTCKRTSLYQRKISFPRPGRLVPPPPNPWRGAPGSDPVAAKREPRSAELAGGCGFESLGSFQLNCF